MSVNGGHEFATAVYTPRAKTFDALMCGWYEAIANAVSMNLAALA